MSVVVRDATGMDAAGIASISRENGAYFRVPDADGFEEFIRDDEEWRARPDSIALVAEVEMAVVAIRPDSSFATHGALSQSGTARTSSVLR